MAYSIPAGSVLEIRLRATLFGQVVINTFHYRNEVTYGDGRQAAIDAATDFEAVVWSAIHPALSDKVLNVRIDAQWIYPVRYRVETSTPGQDTGSNVGSTTQTGTAAVVKRHGEQANRQNQGRIYLYGVPINYQGDGVWSTAFITGPGVDLVDAVKATIQTDLSSPLYPVLWSPAAPTTTFRIVGGAINSVIRYQRRREVGVGQ